MNGLLVNLIRSMGVIWDSSLTPNKQVASSPLFKIGIPALNSVVLARLTLPGEYDLMSMALMVTKFVLLVSDLGTAVAIIQRKEL